MNNLLSRKRLLLKVLDHEAVRECGMRVFWENCFGPVATANLLAGKGLSRGSFYNGPDSKSLMFVTSLLKYDHRIRQARLARLEVLTILRRQPPGFS